MFDRCFPGLPLLPVLRLGLLLVCGTTAAPLIGPATQKDDNSSAAPAAGPLSQAPTAAEIAHEGKPTTLSATPQTPEIPVTPPTATPKPTLTIEEEAVRKELQAARISPYGWETDFSKRNVELTEIFYGGVPRDGIPPLDEPVFTTYDDADDWLNSKENVCRLSPIPAILLTRFQGPMLN